MTYMTGQEFKEWRKRTRLSQEQAAIALDYTRQTIRALEHEKSKISFIVFCSCKYLEDHPEVIIQRLENHRANI